MKIIRTKHPITYGDRSKKTGIVAIVVTDYSYREKRRGYRIEVEDCEVTDAADTTTPGAPLKSYTPIATKIVTRSETQVNELFNYFAVDIVNGDNFTAKLRDLIVQGLFLDNMQLPVYNTRGEDWEIIDTDDEVVPYPEEEGDETPEPPIED